MFLSSVTGLAGTRVSVAMVALGFAGVAQGQALTQRAVLPPIQRLVDASAFTGAQVVLDFETHIPGAMIGDYGPVSFHNPDQTATMVWVDGVGGRGDLDRAVAAPRLDDGCEDGNPRAGIGTFVGIGTARLDVELRPGPITKCPHRRDERPDRHQPALNVRMLDDRGRLAIAELLNLSDNIRQLIIDRRSAAEIKRAAKAEGMRFLRESALQKVFAGETSLYDINKVTFVE